MAKIIETVDELNELLNLLNRIAQNDKTTWNERKYLLSIEGIDVDFRNDDTIIELPENIELLINLRQIMLGSCLLQKLPASIGNLTNLEELSIYKRNYQKDYSHLVGDVESSTLPNSIWNLTNLRRLTLIGYTHIELTQSIERLANLTYLFLGNNSLSELPESIGRLTNLTILYLGYDRLSELPESIGKLTNLTSLKLNDNELSELPESIRNLTKLAILDVSNNKLSKLPENMCKLTNLTSLEMGGNNLSELPESICKLTNLTSLNISSNNLIELPEGIGKLTNLTDLIIIRSNLIELPESIGNLVNLTSLDISGNNLRELPESIVDLTNLTSLRLSNINLCELPECICKLTKLKELDIGGNNLNRLPVSLKNVRELESLDVSDNRLSAIPDYFGGFPNLKKLDLGMLHLDALPESLLQLKVPFVSEKYFFLLDQGINIYETTLSTQPISLFFQPSELIQAYYNAKKIAIKDAKVVFLGDGGAGKTHTIMRIRDGGKQKKYDTETTQGIAISDYTNKSISGETEVKFWDFGGQEIMHSVHRCFLTDRCCYVVVVSNRTSDLTQRAAYWLRNIETFTRDCPVILAINRYDNNPNVGINLMELQKNYPNLIGPPVFYSAKDSSEEEFGALTRAIMAQAEKLDSVRMSFPEGWYHIRMELSRRAEQSYYINMEEYYQICRDSGSGINVEDEHQRQICNWLLDWFNDMGVCFSYYKDGVYGHALQKCQILNPEWLTNAIYIIINEGCRHATNGVIQQNTIHTILNSDEVKRENTVIPKSVKYTKDETGYVLNIMRKFKLSYPITEQAEFIPAICPENTPKGFHPDQYTHHIAYEMEYTYLPDSVLHRLMIVCNDKLKMQKIYRKGLRIEDVPNGIIAVADMGMSTTTIKIDVYSIAETPLWNQLQYLRNQILKINDELHLNAEDYIIGEEGDKRARIPVAILLDYNEKGEREIRFPALDNRSMLVFNVDQVLGEAFGGQLLQSAANTAKETQQSMVTVILDSQQFGVLMDQLQKHSGKMDEVVNELGISNDLLRELTAEQQTIIQCISDFTQKPEKEIAETEDKMRKSKKPLEVFCTALGGAANAAQIADFAINHGELLGKILSKIPMIASLVFAALKIG